MSENTYAVAAGFVQFDPREREVNGKKVQDVAVNAVGTQKRVNVTVWPEHAVKLSKGDFIAVEGKFTTRQAQNKDGASITYNNISADKLVVNGQLIAKAERAVEGGSSTASTESAPF